MRRWEDMQKRVLLHVVFRREVHLARVRVQVHFRDIVAAGGFVPLLPLGPVNHGGFRNVRCGHGTV